MLCNLMLSVAKQSAKLSSDSLLLNLLIAMLIEGHSINYSVCLGLFCGRLTDFETKHKYYLKNKPIFCSKRHLLSYMWLLHVEGQK